MKSKSVLLRSHKRRKTDLGLGKRRRTAGERDHTTALVLIPVLVAAALVPGKF